MLWAIKVIIKMISKKSLTLLIWFVNCVKVLPVVI